MGTRASTTWALMKGVIAGVSPDGSISKGLDVVKRSMSPTPFSPVFIPVSLSVIEWNRGCGVSCFGMCFVRVLKLRFEVDCNVHVALGVCQLKVAEAHAPHVGAVEDGRAAAHVHHT